MARRWPVSSIRACSNDRLPREDRFAMLTNTDDRTPPTRIRVTAGLQEQHLAELVQLDEACSRMYHDVGFDAAEVPLRSQADFVALARHNSLRVAEADHVVAG